MSKVDYSKAIIYTIRHNTDESLIFVDSTTNYNQRIYQHRHKKVETKLCKTVDEMGGWSNFRFAILQECPCSTRNELRIKTEIIRQTLKATLNSFLPIEDDDTEYVCNPNTEEVVETKKSMLKKESKHITHLLKELYAKDKELAQNAVNDFFKDIS